MRQPVLQNPARRATRPAGSSLCSRSRYRGRIGSSRESSDYAGSRARPGRNRSTDQSPAQQSPLGRPPRFQAGIGFLLLLIGHYLLTGVAAFPDARFRRERRPATPAGLRDRFIERKNARFLGQKIRVVEFAMTHKQTPIPSAALGEITHPTSHRPQACLHTNGATLVGPHAAGFPTCGTDVAVPQGVAASPFREASPHEFLDRTATIGDLLVQAPNGFMIVQVPLHACNRKRTFATKIFFRRSYAAEAGANGSARSVNSHDR